MTDTATVDAIIKEILATMVSLITDGKNMRLNFKVGSLIVSNNLIQWQHSREILRKGAGNASMDRSTHAG